VTIHFLWYKLDNKTGGGGEGGSTLPVPDNRLKRIEEPKPESKIVRLEKV